MGIIEEALRVLGESAERINQVKAAAIARQKKYVEDNTKDWELYSIFKVSRGNFIKIIEGGNINGPLVGKILNSVQVSLDSIKRLPDVEDKNGGNSLTSEQFDQFLSDNGSAHSASLNFAGAFSEPGKLIVMGDDVATTLAGFLDNIVNELTKWVAEKAGLDENAARSMAAGTDNENELPLIQKDRILYAAAKSWFEDGLGDLLKGTDENNVEQKTFEIMSGALRAAIKDKIPDIEHIIEFVDRKSLLEFVPSYLKDHSVANDSPESCAESVLKDIIPQILESTEDKVSPLIYSLEQNYGDLNNFSLQSSLPADCRLLNAARTQIYLDAGVELLTEACNNFDFLVANFDRIREASSDVQNKFNSIHTKVAELRTELDNLRSAIDNLPVDLKNGLNAVLDAELFTISDETKLKNVVLALQKEIESYYQI